MFDFSSQPLRCVPQPAVDIMNGENFFYTVKKTNIVSECSFAEICKPCVTYVHDNDHDCIFVMPVDLSEFN